MSVVFEYVAVKFIREHSEQRCGRRIGFLSGAHHDFPCLQGLEGYSRNPRFGQNTVRDSGKREIS